MTRDPWDCGRNKFIEEFNAFKASEALGQDYEYCDQCHAWHLVSFGRGTYKGSKTKSIVP